MSLERNPDVAQWIVFHWIPNRCLFRRCYFVCCRMNTSTPTTTICNEYVRVWLSHSASNIYEDLQTREQEQSIAGTKLDLFVFRDKLDRVGNGAG